MNLQVFSCSTEWSFIKYELKLWSNERPKTKMAQNNSNTQFYFIYWILIKPQLNEWWRTHIVLYEAHKAEQLQMRATEAGCGEWRSRSCAVSLHVRHEWEEQQIYSEHCCLVTCPVSAGWPLRVASQLTETLSIHSCSERVRLLLQLYRPSFSRSPALLSWDLLLPSTFQLRLQSDGKPLLATHTSVAVFFEEQIGEHDFTKYNMFQDQQGCWSWNNITINQSELRYNFSGNICFWLTIRVRCFYTLVNLLSFPTDFRNKGLGLGVGIGLSLYFWTVMLIQDQQKMLIQEHVLNWRAAGRSL